MKAGKKAKKEEEKPGLCPFKLIKPPSQAKVLDQIASIKQAIKGKELDDEQVKMFRKLEESEEALGHDDIERLKGLYAKAVYDKATPSRGGGRMQRVY